MLIVVSVILFLLYAWQHSRANHWKRNYRNLRSSAMADQRKLKTQIDKLQGRG